MNVITSSRADLLRTLSEKIACNLFISMLNPKYRGEKFNFHEFDIDNYAVSMIGPCLVKTLREDEEPFVKKCAKLEWLRILREAGEGVPKYNVL